MKTSDIYMEFIIWSKHKINHDEITNIVGVQPTKVPTVGDYIRDGLTYKDSSWEYKTPILQTFHVEDVISIILEIVKPKVEELAMYIQQNKLNVNFCIVIEYYSNKFPSLYISRELIAICHKLNAEIDNDIYICTDQKLGVDIS